MVSPIPTPRVVPPPGKLIWARWLMIVIYVVLGVWLGAVLFGGDSGGGDEAAAPTATLQGVTNTTVEDQATTTTRPQTTTTPAPEFELPDLPTPTGRSTYQLTEVERYKFVTVSIVDGVITNVVGDWSEDVRESYQVTEHRTVTKNHRDVICDSDACDFAALPWAQSNQDVYVFHRGYILNEVTNFDG